MTDLFCAGVTDLFCVGVTDLFCVGVTDLFCAGVTDLFCVGVTDFGVRVWRRCQVDAAALCAGRGFAGWGVRTRPSPERRRLVGR